MQYKNHKTEKLINTFGKVVKSQREKRTGKSQTLFSYEYELDSGNLCRIENGKIEPKLTMIWRLAEALDMKPSKLIEEIENVLGDDFYIINK